MIKFFEWFWLRCIKNWWSKMRWYKESKELGGEVTTFTNDSDMMQAVKKLNTGYKWVMDGMDDLFDTYMPAPYAYNRMNAASNGTEDPLLCDCDDVHGGILHLLERNGYDVALITLATIPVTQSHTMTAIRYTEEDGSVYYKVINYTSLRGPYNSLQEFVDSYGVPVRYWCLQKYDNNKGMYYNIKKDW